ncbi:MAG: DnaJ-class molecular chaperone [Oceanicoccus sp.]|jgi:DnaJ-class molecular chaperone
MSDEQEVCSVCNGSRVNDLSDKGKRDENGDIIYHQTQCPHCNGTGLEPK